MVESAHMFDVFLSYRHADAADVIALVQTLRERGLAVWVDRTGIEDFAGIQRGIEEGLDTSKVLLAWYSSRYPESLACQWELTRAFLAGQADGDPRRRVLLVNPEASNGHIHPIELRDALYLAAPTDAAARAAAAAAVAAHVGTITAPIGQIRPAQKPRWLGAASGDGSNRFVGRLRELWAIHSGLHAAEVPIIRSGEARPLVYLSGMGGAGKSLTAETYGIRFAAAYPGGVFWLKAFGHDAQHPMSDDDRSAALDDQLREFSSGLGLPTDHLTPAQTRTQLAATLTHAGTYLWVVDDLPSGMPWSEVQAWLALSPGGCTLITTRGSSSGWAGTHVALDGLDEVSAFALLTRLRTPADDGEAEEARALVRDLGSLALGLELAAVLVHRRGFAAVRASVAAPTRDVLELAASLLTTQGEQLPHRAQANLSLSTTLSLSIDGLSAPGKDLLRLAAQLAAAPIPRQLIVGAFAAADGSVVSDAEDAADLAVAAAAAESLVREPAPTQTLVHSLVSRTMRLRDAGHEARWQELRNGAVSAINDVLDDGVGDLREHGRLAETAVHARALLAAAMDSTDRLGSLDGRVLDGLYVYDLMRGNYREARRSADCLIANAAQVLGPEHEYTLIFMSYVGSLLMEEGRLPEALDEFARIYEIRHRTLGARHPDTLKSISDAALVLYKQGELGRARPLQEDVLAARLELFGRGHPDVATAMNNLAATLSDLGETAPAISLQQEVVAVRRELLGANHAETLSALGNLAVMQRAAGDVAGAQATQDGVTSQRPEGLDDNHPQTLTALNNLAATLYSQGRLADASAAAERCLLGRREVLGADHPDTLATQNNLGAILMGLLEHRAAAVLLEDTLERCRRTLGPQHPATFQAAYHLVLTLVHSGESSRVKTILEHDLAPLAQRDPATLAPELRDARERLLPLFAKGD